MTHLPCVKSHVLVWHSKILKVRNHRLSRIASPNTPSIWFLAPTQLFLRKHADAKCQPLCMRLGLYWAWADNLVHQNPMVSHHIHHVHNTNCHNILPHPRAKHPGTVVIHLHDAPPASAALSDGCLIWLSKALVTPKTAGKWMFIPSNMDKDGIGFDPPHPHLCKIRKVSQNHGMSHFI